MLNQLRKRITFEIVEFREFAEADSTNFRDRVQQHQYKTLWTRAVNCILAVWLISSPFVFSYGRTGLRTSDVITGAIILVAEALSFSTKLVWLRWCTPVAAFWLLFAPLVFWSPSSAVYMQDTLIAALLIAFAVLIPGIPGRAALSLPGPDQPPAWSYNPSSWIRRWLGIALALLGFFISRYLAARQLGYMPHAADLFFPGGSTDRVLHSSISRAFPISDAGFGAVAYLLEVLAGFMGDRARWRTSPWVVLTFAVLVVPLGITSLTLVVLQPTTVGAWCALCLVAACGVLISVPLAVHEIIAMGQFLLDAKKRGKSVWHVFWYGGTIDGAGNPDPDRSHYTLAQRWIPSVQGVTVPVSLILQIVAGAALMILPGVVHLHGAVATMDYVLGSVAVTAAVVATAEVTRTARLLNLPVALAVAGVALLTFDNTAVCVVHAVAAAVLLLSAPHRGELLETYGSWDKFIK
jgi:uncharacterized membrane protein